ncbi:hypothetical protein Acy02nite_15360 [Actinoplanes cyaneus]|uniref:Secreted protein n=1 Tax=Actinoplanes cyaneus TaxID=52696 RepID=A0A919IKK4_9ACTN|nr:hypothetical protein [Actinoplanes cyaneus]MCW2142187.1 hypothetical protein [Actinoplanes cyaneus]GID63655.1 hypothetical protein Acy02nite_15360 [Actinoplanes cyaneus]
MHSLLLAGIIPAMLVPGVAHAGHATGPVRDVPAARAGTAPGAPASSPEPRTGLLGTFAFGRAAVIGAGGEEAGVWSGASVHSGFAGDDLVITYVPRLAPARHEQVVYTARYNEVAYPQAECERVGASGVALRVWVSYRCRTGVAPNYTLLVR